VSYFKLIAGLGNPGKRYQDTRHNIGFMLLDYMGEHLGADAFEAGLCVSWRAKLGCLIREVRIKGHPVYMVKPQSYMNMSGEPLSGVLRFFKLSPADLIVVHDDIDLPLGVMRIKSGGGDGGHNGIRSITAFLGTADFVRLKLGVGRPSVEPAAAGQTSEQVVDWVLGRFTDREAKTVQEILGRGEMALTELCTSGIEVAQRKFN